MMVFPLVDGCLRTGFSLTSLTFSERDQGYYATMVLNATYASPQLYFVSAYDPINGLQPLLSNSTTIPTPFQYLPPLSAH